MNPGIYTIESVHGFRETVVLNNFRVGPQPSQETSDNESRVESEVKAEAIDHDKRELARS